MTSKAPRGPVLAAGVTLAAVAMLLTHPVAVAACLVLALAYAHALGVRDRTHWVHRGALGIGVAVLAFNAIFSWNGATALWEAPFRVAVLGRPRITLEAVTWGVLAGTQLATTVLALGAATLAVPPERLHRALVDAGAPAALATAAGLALRMVPDTAQDARAMRQALATRGVDTGTVRGNAEVLVPLTARTLDRALVSEEALRMRGFDPSRSPRRRTRVSWAALVGVLGVAAAAALAWIGPGRPSVYPQVAASMDPVTLGLVAAVLAVPVLLVGRVIASSR